MSRTPPEARARLVDLFVQGGIAELNRWATVDREAPKVATLTRSALRAGGVELVAGLPDALIAVWDLADDEDVLAAFAAIAEQASAPYRATGPS